MSATGRSIERETEGQGWSEGRALLAAVVIIMGGALAAGILAADAPLLVVVAASVLFLGIAMVLRPDIATLVGIGLIYSNAAVVLVRFHGAPAFVAAMVPLLLVVPLARDLVVRRLPVVAPTPLRWMLVLFGIYLVSALFSTDTQRSWDEVVVFITEGLLLYFLVINVVRSPEMIRGVTWVLLGGGALISLAVVHQAITGNYDSNYFGFAQADALIKTGVTTLTGDVLVPRMAGSIGETNRFAQTMLMLVPLGIFRAISERSTLLRVTAGVMTLLITLGVVLSFSRGAAVGLAALVLALLVLRMIKVQYVIAMLLVLVMILVAFPQYTNRITSLAGVGGLDTGTNAVDNSLLSRATETLSAALVMVDHPVIGVGPGMFPVYYEAYANTVGILVRNDIERQAHNLYLGFGAELGVPGLIVFLLIAYSVVRMLLAARRASIVKRPDLERLTTPFLLALMTYYVTGMFLHLSFARFYWLMLAVATAAAVVTLREMASADEPAAAEARSMPRGVRAQRPVNQSV
jgi:putative inorganic carbon (hco3(-)) transporter